MSTTRRHILLVTLIGVMSCFLLPHNAVSITPEEARAQWNVANELYAAEKYKEAADKYDALLEAGIVNGVLLYNTGNALAKLNRTGEAVAMYVRALRLSPRDSDITRNLRMIQPAINEQSSFILLIPFEALKNLLSLSEWTLLLDISFWLVCFTLIIFILTRSSRIKTASGTAIKILGSVFVIVLVFWGITFYQQHVVVEAVVANDDTIARVGPGVDTQETFRLAAGTRVRWIEQPINGWVRVRFPDGKSAYLSLDDLIRI